MTETDDLCSRLSGVSWKTRTSLLFSGVHHVRVSLTALVGIPTRPAPFKAALGDMLHLYVVQIQFEKMFTW